MRSPYNYAVAMQFVFAYYNFNYRWILPTSTYYYIYQCANRCTYVYYLYTLLRLPIT